MRYTITAAHPAGKPVLSGSTVKLRFFETLHDSVLAGTGGQLPVYQPLVPGLMLPGTAFDVLAQGLHAGDSVVVYERLDSLIASGRLKVLPAGIDARDELITHLVVLDVFGPDLMHPDRVDSLVAADRAKETAVLDKKYALRGDSAIKAWLSRHQETADILPLDGTSIYRQVMGGKGSPVDSGDWIRLRLDIQTLGGQPLWQHADTITTLLGSPRLPRGIDHGLRGLQPGSLAVLYIPAMQAFGGHPPQAGFPAYADLRIEACVLSKAPAPPLYRREEDRNLHLKTVPSIRHAPH